MSGDQALGAVATLGALVLVGSAVIARRRRGEPIAHAAMIWAALFGAAFLVALAIDGRL